MTFSIRPRFLKAAERQQPFTYTVLADAIHFLIVLQPLGVAGLQIFPGVGSSDC
ncbi:hypothetical protein RWA02_22370 (plasmid) [Sinorhizobium meliloti]|uniref:hypothetical protein n=1 Tax=Rhizobium meliloti TaxID=382 RepID=UPI001297E03A|nr:hypothetical protein [Sinorhizobium meliloti]MBP2469164.1 hypothetical protein [Sinorhizobium meliloti]MCM5693968.1 hypothetical protein [Sinorhizobium meliloti]MDW9413650.1 hypothetical protein [Sinorhizobium meliloti]MDW9445401.1 hypothetical protein [Sinorhizobium meliloti]MDW9476914.1 hypothetical protein [Sinorhizobium meliloti]